MWLALFFLKTFQFLFERKIYKFRVGLTLHAIYIRWSFHPVRGIAQEDVCLRGLRLPSSYFFGSMPSLNVLPGLLIFQAIYLRSALFQDLISFQERHA